MGLQVSGCTGFEPSGLMAHYSCTVKRQSDRPVATARTTAGGDDVGGGGSSTGNEQCPKLDYGKLTESPFGIPMVQQSRRLLDGWCVLQGVRKGPRAGGTQHPR